MVSGSFKFFWARLSVVASFLFQKAGELQHFADAHCKQYLNPLRSFSLIFFLLLSPTILSQEQENLIYRELDQFIEDPSEEKLQELSEKEKEFSKGVNSKADQLALVILDCNMGYYYQKYSQLQMAINYYEKAWTLFETNQLNDYDITEFCLKPLGNLYTITGAFTNAETTIKQYLFLAEKNNDQGQEIAGILNLSVVYHNTGNYTTAIGILQKGLGKSELTTAQISALENNLITNLFAAKQYEAAENLLQESIKNQTATFKTFKNAAQLALQRDDFVKAEKFLLLSEKQLKKQTNFAARELAQLYTEKAQLYLLQNKTDKAQEQLQKALQVLLPALDISVFPKPTDLYPENTFISIFDTFAQLSDNINEALEYYDLSFYVASLLQQQLDSQQSKILHQLDNRLRSEACIELLFEAYTEANSANLLQLAFNYAESSKAAVLTETQNKRSLLEQHPDDELLKREQRLASLQEGLINDLVRAQLTESKPGVINEITNTLNKLHLELNSLRSQIIDKYPNQPLPILNLTEVQHKLLEDNATMLYFFYGKTSLYKFTITKDKAVLDRIELNKNFLESLSGFIGCFENASVINNAISNFKEVAFSLFESLKINDMFSEENLVIVPDGLLNFVSFEALITAKTESNNFSEIPFLVRKQAIGYNSTARFYTKSYTISGENSVLGIFPVFEGTEKELEYSVKEAEDLEKSLNSKLFLNDEATKKAFTANATKFPILHLSTHASGGDFVIPANIEFADDVMLLHELYAMNLSSNLVVLSACETGIGKLQKGEGAMSIARGFQYAGAQNLLFSLWKVNDLSTAQLMSSFYKHYAGSGSAIKANHASKIDYLNDSNKNNAKKSPYYWSSFVYYGTLSEITMPQTDNRATSLIIIVAFVIAVGFLFWFFRRKKLSHNLTL